MRKEMLTEGSPAIIVMAKAPVPGRVKTRLCPAISEEQAASLAACFARDVVEKVLSLAWPVIVAYAPAEERGLLAALLPSSLLWTPQRGQTLGERMQSALEEAGALGFSPLVMIGTDSPTMPPSLIQKTVETLDTDLADIVLGPAEDGGFYLIAMRYPVVSLFNNVAWSTVAALADTLRNTSSLNLRVAQLPVWYDVDTPEDLERLQNELRANPTARKWAPHTYRWLQSLSS